MSARPRTKTPARAPAPLLSDRQAALFAAVNTTPGKTSLDELLSLADSLARWLAGEERVQLAEAKDQTARAPSKHIIEAAFDRLRKSLRAAFPDDARAQQEWASGWCKKLGIRHVDDAQLADIRGAIAELSKLKPGARA